MAGAARPLPQKINETESFALGGACQPTRLACSVTAVLTASAIPGALRVPFCPNGPGKVSHNFGRYRARSQRSPFRVSWKFPIQKYAAVTAMLATEMVPAATRWGTVADVTFNARQFESKVPILGHGYTEKQICAGRRFETEGCCDVPRSINSVGAPINSSRTD